MPPTPRDTVTITTSATLAAVAALHVAWGLRLDIPGVDRDRIADAVSGAGRRPSPAACLGVAGLVAAAAGLVAGHPARTPRLVRAGRTGVAIVLGARGAIGLAGRTDLVAPGTVTPQMQRWDRRLYTPLALALAAGAAHSARPSSASG